MPSARLWPLGVIVRSETCRTVKTVRRPANHIPSVADVCRPTSTFYLGRHHLSAPDKADAFLEVGGHHGVFSATISSTIRQQEGILLVVPTGSLQSPSEAIPFSPTMRLVCQVTPITLCSSVGSHSLQLEIYGATTTTLMALGAALPSESLAVPSSTAPRVFLQPCTTRTISIHAAVRMC